MKSPEEKRSSQSNRLRTRADVRAMLPGVVGPAVSEISLDMSKPRAWLAPVT